MARPCIPKRDCRVKPGNDEIAKTDHAVARFSDLLSPRTAGLRAFLDGLGGAQRLEVRDDAADECENGS
jgi:hypothetical protein